MFELEFVGFVSSRIVVQRLVSAADFMDECIQPPVGMRGEGA